MQVLRLTLLDFAVIFFASGAVVLAPVTSATLWRSKPIERHGSRWFVLLTLAATAYLITEIINFGGFYALSPRFYYSPLRFTFAFGPLFFFFVRELTDPNYRWKQIDWLHWVLPILQLLLSLTLGFQSVEVKHLFWQQVDIPWYRFFDSFWTASSIIGYGLASILTLRIDAPPARKKVVWTLIIVFLSVGLVTFTVDVVFANIFKVEFYRYPFWNSLPIIIYSVSLVFITIRGAVFYNLHNKFAKPRREHYGIQADQLKQLTKQLTDLMETKQPFLNPNLTRLALAQQMGISSKHLSYIINEGVGKSYNDFVNHYRIEYACKLLKDDAYRDRSILDIALETGFSSKSTFNRLFRLQTGQTPSQLRKQHKNQPK